LFHEGGQIVELINLATFAPAGLLLASVPSCSLARVVVRPRLAEVFAPLWLSLVVKDRFIKRARWALPAHVMFHCSPSRPQGARMLRAARLSHFDFTLLFEVTDSSCFQRLIVPC